MRETECPACGEPIGLALAPQVVAGRLISGFYWWLVSQLADVRYNPDGSPDAPVQFVSDELQGLLAPLVRYKGGNHAK